MTRPTLHLVVGLPGAGKTTLALALGVDVVIDFGLWGRNERAALRQAEAPDTTWPMSDAELADRAARIDVPTPAELDGSEPIDAPPGGFVTGAAWRAHRGHPRWGDLSGRRGG